MNEENKERDAASALIEEAIGMTHGAGMFCDSCVEKVDTGLRPVDFCSSCHSALMLFLQNVVEREIAAVAAKYPGRFTITNEGEETFVKRNW
jgi:hypothetical protein